LNSIYKHTHFGVILIEHLQQLYTESHRLQKQENYSTECLDCDNQWI